MLQRLFHSFSLFMISFIDFRDAGTLQHCRYAGSNQQLNTSSGAPTEHFRVANCSLVVASCAAGRVMRLHMMLAATSVSWPSAGCNSPCQWSRSLDITQLGCRLGVLPACSYYSCPAVEAASLSVCMLCHRVLRPQWPQASSLPNPDKNPSCPEDSGQQRSSAESLLEYLAPSVLQVTYSNILAALKSAVEAKACTACTGRICVDGNIEISQLSDREHCLWSA